VNYTSERIESQEENHEGTATATLSKNETRLGEKECPRCHMFFTASYYVDGEYIQSRCFSCEMKWPFPRVV